LKLQAELKNKMPVEWQQELFKLLEECEMGIYTGVQTESEKEELLFRASALLHKMENRLH
jgi:hypothetical protein